FSRFPGLTGGMIDPPHFPGGLLHATRALKSRLLVLSARPRQIQLRIIKTVQSYRNDDTLWKAAGRGVECMQRKKIDTHHHFFPAVYVDAVGWELLAAVMPGGKPPTWSAQAALDMMEENGIETAILSISAGPSLPKAGQLLRSCNEAAADLRRVYPGRFGSF